MIIRCPKCHFQREMPGSAIEPGKKYKVTCPRCGEVFGFSLHVPEEDLKPASPAPVPEDQAAPDTAAAADPAQDPRDGEGRGEDARDAAPDGAPAGRAPDDALPPGAEVLDADGADGTGGRRGEAPAPVPSGEGAGRRGGGLLARWRSVRENLRRYDEAQDDPGSPYGDGRPEGAPWEQPEYYGFWGCFTRTLLGVMFRPREFFLHVRCNMSLIRPLLFYVLMSIIQMLASRFWTIKILREAVARGSDPQAAAFLETLMQNMNLSMMLLFTPFAALFTAVFLAGVYHLTFRIVQPDRADFATTLRIVCYSSAPFILYIAPGFGSSIASGWSIAVVFIGCKYALNMPWTRTLLALLPLILLGLAFVSQLNVFMHA
ncbi:MAG: YIP1 family protein [Desulfovibrio sp.]